MSITNNFTNVNYYLNIATEIVTDISLTLRTKRVLSKKMTTTDKICNFSHLKQKTPIPLGIRVLFKFPANLILNHNKDAFYFIMLGKTFSAVSNIDGKISTVIMNVCRPELSFRQFFA